MGHQLFQSKGESENIYREQVYQEMFEIMAQDIENIAETAEICGSPAFLE